MNKKNKLIKGCLVYEDIIIISFEDTRDSYVCNSALGEIGNINISEDGIFMFPKYDTNQKIKNQRERILIKYLKEIFNEDDFDMFSGDYYIRLKEIINNGYLLSLGYEIDYQNTSILKLIKDRSNK